MSDACDLPLDEMRTRGTIDTHVHLWTQDTHRYPITAPFTVGDMRPPGFAADDLLRHSRPAGVDRVVLIQMSFYGHDNSYMLEAIAARPHEFRGVALVDERDHSPDTTLKELRSRGVRGVRLSPAEPGDAKWLDRSNIQSIWRSAAGEQLAVCLLINPQDVPAVDRMCQRHGSTTVVVDHCARIGGDGQIRESDLKNLCNLARHRGVHVKLSAFYYLGAKRPPYDDLAPMIRRLCDAFGPERLMWGSDCPFQLESPHSYGDSLTLIRERLQFLSTSDRTAILRGTAEAVFFDD